MSKNKSRSESSTSFGALAKRSHRLSRSISGRRPGKKDSQKADQPIDANDYSPLSTKKKGILRRGPSRSSQSAHSSRSSPDVSGSASSLISGSSSSLSSASASATASAASASAQASGEGGAGTGSDRVTGVVDAELASLDERGFNDAMSLLEVDRVHAYLKENSRYVELSDTKRWTPMHTACQMGNLELIQLLYEHGASVLATNTSGATPLHYWFGYGVRDPKPVEEFLEKVQQGERAVVVDWNMPNNSGNTFLHYAVQGGASSLVPYLLKQNINVNYPNSMGITPLLVAIWQRDIPVVKQLLEYGADLWAKSKKGESALVAAKESQSEEMYALVKGFFETRRLENLTNVINELVKTETTYVQDLGIVQEVFMQPLVNDKGISDIALQTVFCNLPDLYSGNSALLEDLKQLLDLPAEQRTVGRIFMKHMDSFRNCIDYCKNQSICLQSLKVLLNEPSLKQWFAKIHRNKRLRSLDLEAYLVTPMQRICRYPLLLREVIKYTDEDNDDKPLLREAMREIECVVAAANEAKRVADHADDVIRCLSDHGIEFSTRSRLLDGGLIFYHGDESRIGQEHRYYLFTDVFVLCKEARTASSTKASSIARPRVVVLLDRQPFLWHVQDGDVGNQQLRNAFGISHGGNDRIILSAPTLAAKARLYRRIAHAISVLKGDAEFESQLVGRVLQPHEIFLATITAATTTDSAAGHLESTPTLLSSSSGSQRALGGPDSSVSVNAKLVKRLLNRVAVGSSGGSGGGVGSGMGASQRSRSRRELNPSEPDYKGFCVSVLEGDVEAVSACLDAFPEFVSVSDAKGATAAHLAARSGDLNMLRLLKSAKASLAVQNQGGETPLHLLLGSRAAGSQVVPLLQSAMRSREITLEEVNKAGDTLLHYACWSLGDEAAHFLIESGADVNAANNAGVTPLLIAVVCHKALLAECLLERGANVWAQTIDRENPLLFAMQSDSSRLSSCLLDFVIHSRQPLAGKKRSRVHMLHSNSGSRTQLPLSKAAGVPENTSQVFQSAREKFLAKMLQAQQLSTASTAGATRRPVLPVTDVPQTSVSSSGPASEQQQTKQKHELPSSVVELLTQDVIGKTVSSEERSHLLSSFRPSSITFSTAPVTEARLTERTQLTSTAGEPTLSEALWALQESTLKCLQPVVCGLERVSAPDNDAVTPALEATVKLLADLNANLTKLRARVHLEEQNA
mmetsp:Transcript_6403/g.19413  ORF Transcript_6403/g.19413 Transcript_6403/m.19413 type:complete len:1200 (-) Transcript_6403:166-3765(-)|eukprot:CAMPEP_0174236192 /NCGR_PEP_ID=MMETSP0417-20130205/5396_1 /TAXON_ID=242541 /ORGANISM="Mayorella sp, Strain BSH-02190019" /LENGTH=1199 /DNA_ID=CAMNT_0015314799 /DNA_START=64 /DNA_END=3663 /DNA_ORIENTATION=-